MKVYKKSNVVPVYFDLYIYGSDDHTITTEIFTGFDVIVDACDRRLSRIITTYNWINHFPARRPIDLFCCANYRLLTMG